MNTDKKTRGRPKKKDSLLETNNDDLIIITDDSVTQTENLDICNTSIEKEIKPRGRPKKYSDEERQEKYKEASRNWKINHQERCKDMSKIYYEKNSEEIMKQTYNYQTRSRIALRLLSDMIKHDEIKSDKYRDLVEKLINNKEIIMI
jgi:hypothetical protein